MRPLLVETGRDPRHDFDVTVDYLTVAKSRQGSGPRSSVGWCPWGSCGGPQSAIIESAAERPEVDVHAEVLTRRVVEIIESAALPHLDATALVAALTVVLAGAGLVNVRDYALGGGDSLPLLVAEPFPRVEASLGVVPARDGIDDVLTARLRRYAGHPAVDGLVIVNGLADDIPRPRFISGVPVRVAIAEAKTGSDAS